MYKKVGVQCIYLLKKVLPHQKKMLYFKTEQHKNNSVCLTICVGVLALIQYLICDKWGWNNKVLDIWLTLDHIRKVALLKSHKYPCLSCRCHPGSSSKWMAFYLASSMESIPPSANYCGINPSLTGSFSDAFPSIQRPHNAPPDMLRHSPRVFQR